METHAELKLRPVAEAEIETWARVTLAALPDAGYTDAEECAESFRQEPPERQRAAYLVWRGEEAVGRLRLRFDEDLADAWGLGLVPGAAEQGLGPALPLALEAEARRLGAQRILVGTLDGAQVEWFAAAGFRPTKLRTTMKARLQPRPVRCGRAMRHPRPGDPADVEAMGRLLHEAYIGAIDWDGESPEQAQAEAQRMVGGYYGDFLPDCSYLLVGDGGELAGAALVSRPADDWALLAEVAVHPRYRGQGYARQLIQSAMNACLAHGFLEMKLSVTLGNVPAEGLYRRMGFEEEGEREQHMAKDLSPQTRDELARPEERS